jgi:hypothetical protein
MNRRNVLRSTWGAVAAFALVAAVCSDSVQAHHGWGWATDEEFELTGTVTGVQLGNPHGELTLDVAGEEWVVEIGQPWRNERAGLTEELLADGTEVTAHGHRSAKEDERLMKAERLIIAGEDYDLYPDRPS